ncbi:MAG: N-acetylmuramoyl-L-alanine amidase [Myxococcaceae bacterium]
MTLALPLTLLLTTWPAHDAALTTLELPAAKPRERKLRVAVDAGHGAPANEGNHGCWCQAEQEHTLQVANVLAIALEATGRFEVKRLRVDGQAPKYGARIAAAEAWKADVIISLHSDARGIAFPREVDGGVCWQNPDAPGFAVLWNDEGALFPARERLGRVVGARLREAGFLAYSGYDYGDLYRQDEVEPSGWIDKRPLKKRVYFLRASSKVPTVIIETHHALDLDEVARWKEPLTFDAFSAAIAAALLDYRDAPTTAGK